MRELIGSRAPCVAVVIALPGPTSQFARTYVVSLNIEAARSTVGVIGVAGGGGT
jgi:hypothetical protein